MKKPTKYEEQIPLTPSQRDFIYESELTKLKEQKGGSKDLEEELKNLIIFGIERYIKTVPGYDILERNKKFLRRSKSITLFNRDDRMISSIKKEVEKYAKLKGYCHIYSQYTKTFDLDHEIVFPAELYDSIVPGYLSIEQLEKIFEGTELIRITNLLTKIKKLEYVEENYLSEFNSSYYGYRRHLGKFMTWGEIYQYNPSWYEKLYDEFSGTEAVMETIKRLKEKELVKLGKSDQIKLAVNNIKALVKHCNIKL